MTHQDDRLARLPKRFPGFRKSDKHVSQCENELLRQLLKGRVGGSNGRSKSGRAGDPLLEHLAFSFQLVSRKTYERGLIPVAESKVEGRRRDMIE